jgi:hydrogenase expression/formation protein HypC
MCLAVPAKIIARDGEEAVVDLQGNSLRISTVLTPEVAQGDWVLVHAGFAITRLEEEDARQTWDYLRQAFPELVGEAGAPRAGEDDDLRAAPDSGGRPP